MASSNWEKGVSWFHILSGHPRVRSELLSDSSAYHTTVNKACSYKMGGRDYLFFTTLYSGVSILDLNACSVSWILSDLILLVTQQAKSTGTALL